MLSIGFLRLNGGFPNSDRLIARLQQKPVFLPMYWKAMAALGWERSLSAFCANGGSGMRERPTNAYSKSKTNLVPCPLDDKYSRTLREQALPNSCPLSAHILALFCTIEVVPYGDDLVLNRYKTPYFHGPNGWCRNYPNYRRRSPAKGVGPEGSRGFESLRLRHLL